MPDIGAMNPTAHEMLRQYFRQRLPFADEQLAAIETLFEPRQVRRHELLQIAGEPARYGAFVVRGCLRSFVVDAKGKEHIVQFAPEQWWVSDQHSLLHGTPALFAIDALEDAEVLVFTSDFYQQLNRFSPEFPTFFYALLQNSVHAMQKRLVMTLSASAEERYLDFLQTYPTLALRLPQKMIAAYLGVTPESLSRIRRELAG